ncbi:hypothetical protein IV500_04840 [Paeniglutamicibacter antarcticus]|uniref:Uncharacterized protein n=1 Tax=Arthrobacter terrae TaxID=2935737 RepID=A0A931G4S7_9MICC|nr:hypothetical protein [Arthrobacter terrae]MBG0738745.1 hypothetical protein [Arthrobacter terrae]
MTTQKTEEPTPEQAAWDKKRRYYARNSWIAVSVWALLSLGPLAWIIMETTVPFVKVRFSGLPENDPVVAAAVASFGYGVLFAILIVMASGGLSLPIRKTVVTAYWILGKRPADGYRPRLPKPIDMDIRQISADVQIATVGK